MKTCIAVSAICCLREKQYDGAIREYNALVASNPVDKAGAEFEPGAGIFRRGTERQGAGQRAGRA